MVNFPDALEAFIEVMVVKNVEMKIEIEPKESYLMMKLLKEQMNYIMANLQF